MVSRSAKNRYTWHGRAKLAETLAILKRVGEEHRYGQQMRHIRQRGLDADFDLDGEEKENRTVVRTDSVEQGQKELFFVELPGVEFKAGEKQGVMGVCALIEITVVPAVLTSLLSPPPFFNFYF